MGRKYKPIYKQPRSKEAKLRIFASVMFWVVFTVFIICLFVINWPKIRTTMQNALWPAWFKSRAPQSQAPTMPVPLQDESEAFPAEPFQPVSSPLVSSPLVSSPLVSSPLVSSPPETAVPAAAVPSPDPPSQASPPEPPAPAPPPAVSQPPPSQPPPSQPASSQPASDQSAPRNRTLYFIQIDRNGMLLRSKTIRSIPASNAPLLDVLQSLMKGPTDEEKRLGLISLIPEGTQVISAKVLKDTAYIDVSEQFQYNTYGIDGYAGQLTQLIWTATEFSNVKNIQILIEGRRVDYLGEGIWIGSPIDRDRF